MPARQARGTRAARPDGPADGRVSAAGGRLTHSYSVSLSQSQSRRLGRAPAAASHGAGGLGE